VIKFVQAADLFKRQLGCHAALNKKSWW